MALRDVYCVSTPTYFRVEKQHSEACQSGRSNPVASAKQVIFIFVLRFYIFCEITT